MEIAKLGEEKGENRVQEVEIQAEKVRHCYDGNLGEFPWKNVTQNSMTG